MGKVSRARTSLTMALERRLILNEEKIEPEPIFIGRTAFRGRRS